MSIVIHHNPDCETSRNVLGFIEAAGFQPIIIEYLKPAGRLPSCRACSRRRT